MQATNNIQQVKIGKGKCIKKIRAKTRVYYIEVETNTTPRELNT